jgi:hypothetical protein
MDEYDNYVDLLLEKGLSAKSTTDTHMEYLEKMGDAYADVEPRSTSSDEA